MSYLRIVSSRVIEKFLSVKRLDGFVLCILGWRKTSSSKLLAAWKRFRIVNKGRTFLYRHFLDFEEKYGNISDCRTFSCFKTVSSCRTFSHFIAGTSATLMRYNSYLLLCMDNNLDHPFERKLLSTGRKLQLNLGPMVLRMAQGWQTSIKKN